MITNMPIPSYEEYVKYTPIKCAILRRCQCCGELIIEEHPSYVIAKDMQFDDLVHECKEMGKDLLGVPGHVIGKATHVGFAILEEVKDA